MGFQKFEYESGFYSIYNLGEFEFKDPEKLLVKELSKYVFYQMKIDRSEEQNGLSDEDWDNKLVREAQVFGYLGVAQISKTPVPDKLQQLLTATNKNQQERIIGDNLTITDSELLAFILHASKVHGYNFSQYHTRHLPKGVDQDDLPQLIHKKSSTEVRTIGETPLTQGQQKSVVDQQKVVVAKFIDHPDGSWHCFFTTHNALFGKEEGHGPHLHYISDKFGYSREYVLAQIKNKEYKLGQCPHIFLKQSPLDKPE